MKEKIGKKVFKLVKVSDYSDKMDTTTEYTIIREITYPEVKDWCDHYIIKDNNGNEEEVQSVSVVFAPKLELPEEEMIDKYLSDNELYPVEIYRKGLFLQVSGDGDWKHFHIWLRILMEYLGYKQIAENVTEEDGSDWYGSEHYFLKTA